MTKQEILELRDQGKTYREIADIFGVTRQRVHEKIGKDRIRKCNFEIEKIRFKGVYEFLKEHPTLSLIGFIRHMKGHSVSHAEYEKLKGCLTTDRDSAIKISDIKRLTEYTGMTFEELFAERSSTE